MSAEIRVITPSSSVDDATGWAAKRDQLDRGFRRLPSEQRAALVLH
jgi:hypothetical protein